MEKMRMESVDMTAQNIDRIAELFPNCITEALDEEHSTPEHKVYKKVVNFELLKQMHLHGWARRLLLLKLIGPFGKLCDRALKKVLIGKPRRICISKEIIWRCSSYSKRVIYMLLMLFT